MKINPRLKTELKKIALAKMREDEDVVTIQAACVLSPAMISTIKKMIPQIEDGEIRTEVDESLLGGIIVRRGSRMIDLTLRSMLQKLATTTHEIA